MASSNKDSRKFFFHLLLWMLNCLSFSALHADQLNDRKNLPAFQDSAQVKNTTQKPDINRDFFKTTDKYCVSLNIGTTGVAVELSRRLGQFNFISVQGGILSYHIPFTQNWSNVHVLTTPSCKTPVFGLSFEQFIWADKTSMKAFFRKLKLKAGIQYMLQSKVELSSRLKSSNITVGNTTFSQDEVGKVFTHINGNHLQPFIAAGYDEFFTPKKLSFAADIGAVYVGNLDVNMEATKMLAPSVSEAYIVKKNLKSYRVLPYVVFKLQFKL